MPRLAANLTMMFNEVPFADRFAAAKAAGFASVEFLFPYELAVDDAETRLKSNCLEQALFNLPPGDWAAGDRGIAALPDRRDEFAASLATALPYAKALAAPNVHMMAGIAPADDVDCRRAYVEAARRAADVFGAEGIGVVLEPINPRDMPGYFLNDFDRTAELITEIDRPNVKLQFDIYHRQIIHGDVITGLRKFWPLIAHVQIAAVPLRNEPGTGELDDFRLLRLLDEEGYAGFVGCEYRPAGRTEDGLGWIKTLG